MDSWLKENLVCPRDHHKLSLENQTLTCPLGHTYPYIDGIPIMLLSEAKATHRACKQTLEQAKNYTAGNHPDEEPISQDAVDPYVQKEILGTNGIMYKDLINKLTRYPIPELRLPPGSGQRFLDIGCNWGRWCISAANKGYNAVGIDPSLDAIKAARRVAKQLGLSVNYVVADARYLPFATSSFDIVYSYSVLQHFAKEDAKLSLAEVARTLKMSGTCLIQMPNIYGLRNIYNQWKRGFKRPENFEVRYWSNSELENTFKDLIGSTSLFVDGYFSLNPQTTDMDILPQKYKMVVSVSEKLRKVSENMEWMKLFADSLYVKSIRRAN